MNSITAFEYSYLDEDYQRLYASEIRIGILSRYFAGLAIEHRRSCFATLLPRS